MTYATGQTILDDDYNNFATQVNDIWGVGVGAEGYGQTNTVSTVTAGGTITATQWATLLARINTSASHQGTTLTAIGSPTAGQEIEAHAALQTNINSITSKRFDAAAVGADINTTGTRTTTWTTAVWMTYTINFASEAAARHFFNAGGQLRITTSRTGGSAHAKNSNWAALCTAVGTIVINNGSLANVVAGTSYNAGFTKIGGSGTADILSTTLGYYSATSTETIGFRQYEDSAPYTASYLRVTLRKPSSSQLVVVVGYYDDAADQSYPTNSTVTAYDIVDGTLSSTLTIRRPSTTHLTASWGTPTCSVAVTGS